MWWIKERRRALDHILLSTRNCPRSFLLFSLHWFCVFSELLPTRRLPSRELSTLKRAQHPQGSTAPSRELSTLKGVQHRGAEVNWGQLLSRELSTAELKLKWGRLPSKELSTVELKLIEVSCPQGSSSPRSWSYIEVSCSQGSCFRNSSNQKWNTIFYTNVQYCLSRICGITNFAG